MAVKINGLGVGDWNLVGGSRWKRGGEGKDVKGVIRSAEGGEDDAGCGGGFFVLRCNSE